MTMKFNMNLLPKFKKQTDMDIWFGEDVDFMDVKDLIAPAKITENENHMVFGNNFSRTLLIIDYPSTPKGNWLSKLYRFKGNITITTHYKPVPADKMINHVSNSITELDVRLDAPLSPRRKTETKNKLTAAQNTLDKLMDGDNNQIFHVHTYIHIQEASQDKLESLTQKLNGLLWQLGLKPYVPLDNMNVAFESALPINKNNLPQYTYRNMDTEAASSMMPYDESEILEEDGIIKGKNATTGSVVLVDQYRLKNHNEFVLGMSGAGKSFYMKIDMLRHFMHGYRIFIIDPEREYKDLIKKIGGQLIIISSMSGTIINPLEVMHSKIDSINQDQDDDEEEEETKQSLLHQKIARIKVFFSLLKKDITPLESALIEDSLIKTYNDKDITWETDFSTKTSKDFPILGDLYKNIEEQQDSRLEDFLAILKTFVSGSNSLMFNGHTNVNLDNDLICFDLKDLEEESDVQPAAMFNVLSFLWDEITKDRTTFKRLYVDEAHIMADPDNPRAMKFLFNIYKRIRKYKGGATAATQQIADYLSAVEGKRNYGKAIIGNSQSKFIMTLEESDIKDLKKYDAIKLSEEEEKILRKDAQGEGIIIIGSKRVHMEVEATPEEHKLADPKGYEKKYGKQVGK
ncbi:ATP-binding protein [Peribacillus frigoritolerans]|uniref:VirB4 family type IV secretion system protein n=1 Tax=Peribacillus frigoritolerans TaxID=450367 RepID=UPI0021D0EB5C|nr:ATP-binding protein [Peribacillus frigoritolerans]MCU6603809.1 ATP-binding protein [Peribacillus frigoritolerans]